MRGTLLFSVALLMKDSMGWSVIIYWVRIFNREWHSSSQLRSSFDNFRSVLNVEWN